MHLSNDQFIQKLTEIVEANLGNEQFGVSELARKIGMNRTVLYRKVKQFTKKTISKFISEIRLKRALELLRNNSGNVSEVAYEVGFGSPTYFIKCFNKHYGFPPGEVLKGNHQHTTVDADNKKVPAKKSSAYSRYLYGFIGVILAIIGYYLINQLQIEKSIIVLPFEDFSKEVGNAPILETFRDELIGKLEVINDLTVISRTTADTYKNSNKTIKEIAKELHANYILEGSVTKINDEVKIQLQLISAKDKHLWSKPFVKDITNENTFEVQTEVVTSVVNSLRAVISPSEEKQIARKSTENKAAYNFYSQGVNYQKNYELSRDAEEYVKAKEFYEKAIGLDSTFADAYCRLGLIYIHNLSFTYSGVDGKLEDYNLYLDSGLVMIEKALHYETSMMNEAHRLKGNYYQLKGNFPKAMEFYDIAFKNNERDHWYYEAKFHNYYHNQDFHNTIKIFYKFMNLKPDTSAPQVMIEKLIRCLGWTGFPEPAKKYARELLELTSDSNLYSNYLITIDLTTCNYKLAVEVLEKNFKKDSTNIGAASYIMSWYLHLKDYENAFKYLQKVEDLSQQKNKEVLPDAYIGFLYLNKGMIKKANYHIEGNIEYCNEQIIKENIPIAQSQIVYGLLAGDYAMLGKIELALENFKKLKSRKTCSGIFLNQISELPIYDNINNEPEYHEVIKDLEKKYQREHNKIEKLLIREGVIQQ